jgi:hypothetical protein
MTFALTCLYRNRTPENTVMPAALLRRELGIVIPLKYFVSQLSEIL